MCSGTRRGLANLRCYNTSRGLKGKLRPENPATPLKAQRTQENPETRSGEGVWSLPLDIRKGLFVRGFPGGKIQVSRGRKGSGEDGAVR